MSRHLALTTILGATLLWLASPASAWAHDHSHDHARHGFVLVGETNHYLYHLAKFNSPHRFEGVFRVELYQNGERLQALPATERGVLSALSAGSFGVEDLGRSIVREFSAELYDGYLRSADKEMITDGVTIKIVSRVYWQEIRPDDPAFETLSYIAFGDETDYYLAHRITRAPNYEQILQVRYIRGELPSVDGLHVFVPGRDGDGHPLEEGNEEVFGSWGVWPHYGFTFSVERQILFEPMVLSP